MICVGDVAIAHNDRFSFVNFPSHVFEHSWCINLEGAVTSAETEQMWGVYNTENWYSSFTDFKIGPLFLANNHIHDIDNGVPLTCEALSRQGIGCFGAGLNTEAAANAAVVDMEALGYVLLGFGWPVIGCKAATILKPGVNAFEGQQVKQQALEALERYREQRIVVLIHGNYEFELYPQPGFRRLAMELIDHGVYAVIGHHPHVVAPVESYRGRTIAYSLGNWAFSYGRFFDGRLRFPKSSFHQIAVELADLGDVVHHARFHPPNTVSYEYSEHVQSEDFSLRPQFEGFSHSEYIRWFRENRVKRKGLPVYVNADASMSNWFRDKWVKMRHVLIDAAARSGLKPMRRSG